VQLSFECYFLTASSLDLDHPSPNRGLPTDSRSQSTLSHHSIHAGDAHNEPKHHHRHHHRSKHSDAASHQSKHCGDAGRRSADWVRSQQAGRRVQNAQPLTSVKSGSDEVENVLLIIREEFKRLGFLWDSSTSTSKSETAWWWFSVWSRW